MMKVSREMGPQKGFSLIELMIAVTIGIILVLGLVQVFAASKTAYQLSQGIARNQENSRFAIDFLLRDLRMAGHMGCVNDQSLMLPSGGNINSHFLSAANRNSGNFAAAGFPLRFDISIQGFEANNTGPGAAAYAVPAVPEAGAAGDWTPALPAEISGLQPVKGSDIVVLRYLSANGAPVATFAPGASPAITYAATSGEVATSGSGLYGIADCLRSSVFQASAAPTSTSMQVTTSGLNQSGFGDSNFGETYTGTGQAMLYQAESLAYYIRLNGQNVPALYRTRWTSTPGSTALTRVTEEMVEGVDSMQFLYAEDRESNPAMLPTGYMASMNTAATIGDSTKAARWRRVGAVQVGLLMRSAGVEGEGAATAQATNPHPVLGLPMTPPNDSQYRSVYETTVALRNRLFGN